MDSHFLFLVLSRLLGSFSSSEKGDEFYSAQFDQWDPNSHGVLTIKQLADALNKEASGLSAYDIGTQAGAAKRAESLAKVWDTDGDGMISKAEYMAAMSAAERSASESGHGYAGARDGKASAAYQFGATLYRESGGEILPVAVVPYPSQAWVELTLAQTGHDVSPAASDPAAGGAAPPRSPNAVAKDSGVSCAAHHTVHH